MNLKDAVQHTKIALDRLYLNLDDRETQATKEVLSAATRLLDAGEGLPEKAQHLLECPISRGANIESGCSCGAYQINAAIDACAAHIAKNYVRRSELPGMEEIGKAVEDVLQNYNCQHTKDDEGDGQQLVDVLSPGVYIKEGLEEIEFISEEISQAIFYLMMGGNGKSK